MRPGIRDERLVSDLTTLTIAELRDGFRSRRFSAREVAEAYNAAVAGARALNAYTVETPEDALAAAEAADAACHRDDIAGRWRAVATAVRQWALEHPHEYALVYGSPVPGYAAPQDTVDPAARVSLVFLRLVADGVASGAVDVDDRIETTRTIRQDLAVLRTFAPGVPDAVLSRALLVWTQLFGGISYELFGHLHRVITDYDALFALQVERSGQLLLRGVREP